MFQEFLIRHNVRYRGYLLTSDGRQYKIADLMNPPIGGNPNVSNHRGTGGPPIDFTQPGQNTYLRYLRKYATNRYLR